MSRLRLLLGARAGQAVPPDPGDYPASVIAKSLQAVWDLQTTAGLKTTPTKVVGVDTLPAGWSINATDKWFSPPTSGSHSLDDWDASGFVLIINGSPTVNINRGKFTNAPGGIPEGAYQSLLVLSKTAIVAATSTTFDFSGNTGTKESSIINYGSLTLNDVRAFGAARDHVTSTSGADPGTWEASPQAVLTVIDSYLGSFGQRGGVGDHYEAIHQNLGQMSLTRVFVDGRAGVDTTPSGAGLTGIIYPQSRLGPANWTIEDSILLGREAGGANSPQGPYNIQFGHNTGQASPNNTGVMNDNILSEGISAHVVSTGALAGSGNIDFYTSAVITDAGLA